MKRVLVMSDSHGDEENVRWALERHPDINTVIHLGDGRHEQVILRAAGREAVCVQGNCDFYSDEPLKRQLQWEGVNLLLTHGHEYRVKMRLDTLAYAAESMGVQAALYGHTHRQSNVFAGNVYLINPGSIRSGDYAVLTLQDKKLQCELKNLND